jgi:hypothetical protein
MNKSESIKELSSALAKAQGLIEGALKDAQNPHFRSKYATLASVVDAVKEPLAKHGLSYTQILHDAENAVKVETIILHQSGEWLSCGVLSVPVSKNDAQGFGSALTYARRYSLSAAFGVAPEDDDGNGAAAAAPRKENITPRAGAKERLTPEQIAKVDKVASAMLDWLQNGAIDDAVLTKENAGLDTDETVYLWDRFDSKQRAAMKKAHEAMKMKTMAGSQA